MQRSSRESGADDAAPDVVESNGAGDGVGSNGAGEPANGAGDGVRRRHVPPPASNGALANGGGGEEMRGKASSATTKSLEERSAVPASLYVTVASVLLMQLSAGVWTGAALRRWCASVAASAGAVGAVPARLRDLVIRIVSPEDGATRPDAGTFLGAALAAAAAASVLYVFVLAPLRAGLWTGPRARRHKLHRYMGLLYLIQYALACIEYFFSYDDAKNSLLLHTITLNGA
jgi:hypothetical protein